MPMSFMDGPIQHRTYMRANFGQGGLELTGYDLKIRTCGGLCKFLDDYQCTRSDLSKQTAGKHLDIPPGISI